MSERKWFTEYDFWSRALIVAHAEALLADDLDASYFYSYWFGGICQNLYMAEPKVYRAWKSA